MSEELKPCPFCGAEPGCKEKSCALCSEKFVCVITQYTDQASYVLCSYCRTRGPVGSRRGAITAWNTRPLEDALQARVEALETALSRQSELLRRWMIAFDNEIVIITDQEMTFEIGHEFGNLVAETKKEMFADVLADRALKGEVGEAKE